MPFSQLDLYNFTKVMFNIALDLPFVKRILIFRRFDAETISGFVKYAQIGDELQMKMEKRMEKTDVKWP